jgi:uncharacterized protein
VKLVLDEDESDRARELWHSASAVAASRLIQVESRSALAASRRAGRLTPRGFRASKEELDLLVDEVFVVEPLPSLVRGAADLAERHALRAYNAVHLAAALWLGDPDLVLVAWDQDLRTAARAEGLSVPV